MHSLFLEWEVKHREQDLVRQTGRRTAASVCSSNEGWLLRLMRHSAQASLGDATGATPKQPVLPFKKVG